MSTAHTSSSRWWQNPANCAPPEPLFALDARTGQTQQIQHRVIVYDNHQATAQSGSNAAGNVSDQQMDQDTRLVSAVLDLLTGDAGILIQQPPIAETAPAAE